jgi:hypothetical protein
MVMMTTHQQSLFKVEVEARWRWLVMKVMTVAATTIWNKRRLAFGEWSSFFSVQCALWQ